MWSEEFDKKIRDAADADHPAFNDKSWEKMEPLLDKHLPQEKKRRFIFWLFFGILATGLAVFLVVQQKLDRKQEITQTRSVSKPNTLSKTGKPVNAEIKKSAADDERDDISIVTQKEISDRPAIQPVDHSSLPLAGDINPEKPKQINATATIKKISSARPSNNNIRNKEEEGVTDKPIKTALVSGKKSLLKSQGNLTSSQDDKNEFANIPVANTVEQSAADKVNLSVNPVQSVTESDIASKKTDSTQLPIDSSVAKLEKKDTIQAEIATSNISSPKDKKGETPLSRFSFSLSTGPDISAIGLNKWGTWQWQAGIGIGYAINDRLTIRTGLLVTRKIYGADSADYHPPASFWTYLTNLKNIEANCLVYEIPVSLQYHFANSSRGNWFLSGGLSSFLMKKETYEYYYKNSWGQPASYERSYQNENSHILAVLGISGGYQYKISKRFSLLAEPYFKMPLGGVGYGKVKLNSAGMLFTATLKPFR